MLSSQTFFGFTMADINLEKLQPNLLVLSLVLIVTWMLWEYFSIPKKYPPGPWGLPLVGYLPFLGSKPHVTLAKLSRKYGDVFSLRIANINIVALCSYDSINDALVKNGDDFAARPQEILPLEGRHTGGVLFNSGPSWNAFRRFSISTLKSFGLGKSSLEKQITDEIQILIDIIKSNAGKPMLFADLLQKSVTNIVITMMSGHRMEYDDPVFNKLIQLTRDEGKRVGFGMVESILPLSLQRINFLERLGVKTLAMAMRGVRDIFTGIVEKYSERHRPGSQETFIDSYLTEIEKKGSESSLLKIHDLPYLLRDLLGAGSDTTTNSLNWGFLYMAKYPEIQKKIQNEIDEVIGRDRSPNFVDQKNMPYTEATLMEILRIKTVAPLSLPHSTSKDTTVNGYFIPKNTFILPNLHAVHHNPQTFPEPDEFKPDRFLNAQHQVRKIEHFIPFSLGKRQCLGESLARMEYFLFFTSVLQTFTVKNVEGVPLDLDYDFAIVSIPKTQKLCLILR